MFLNKFWWKFGYKNSIKLKSNTLQIGLGYFEKLNRISYFRVRWWIKKGIIDVLRKINNFIN